MLFITITCRVVNGSNKSASYYARMPTAAYLLMLCLWVTMTVGLGGLTMKAWYVEFLACWRIVYRILQICDIFKIKICFKKSQNV